LVTYIANRFAGRRTVRWLGYLVLVVVLLSFVFVLITTRFHDWRFDAVLTGSMSPTYKIGGIVVIHPVDPLTITAGDVITYKHPVQPDLLITHRVVEVLEDNDSVSFQTRGDGVEVNDSYTVPLPSVKGKVCFYIPFFGHFAEFVKTPPGLVICLIVPCILLTLSEYRRITTLINTRSKNRRMADTRTKDSHISCSKTLSTDHHRRDRE